MSNPNETSSETFAFQAEINQLLSLIINAFYSNNDVFVRELVSNASDALDKLRYTSLKDHGRAVDEGSMAIRIHLDRERKELVVEDTGIGMSRQELVENLGTIAQSGTKRFMESLAANKDAAAGAASPNLIGQFGMGFYSAFLVADRVTVHTRKLGESDASYWTSDASGTFTVGTGGEEFGDKEHGTRVVLHLKTDEASQQYLDAAVIKEIVAKHNAYLAYPILLQKPAAKKEEGEGEEEEDTIDLDEEDGKDEEVSSSPTPPPAAEWEQINNDKPVWLKKPEEVTEAEHADFYKALSRDWQSYLDVKHFVADGQFRFTGLFYVPKQAFVSPVDGDKKVRNVKLYVSRVFISDDSDIVLPEYLSFVRGVVDSDDLPLNISREMLQQSRVLDVIRRTSVKKVIEGIADLGAKDPERYLAFWKAYGRNIKWGATEDQKNSAKLMDLVRFRSSSGEEWTSLAEYVERMGEKQKYIYYIAGETEESVAHCAALEKIREHGYEVLYMTDAIDEYLMQHVKEFRGRAFMSATQATKLFDDPATDAEKEEREALVKEFEPLCEKIKTRLKDRVVRVEVSDRVVKSPCVVVSDTYGLTANMERIVKAQALRQDSPFAPTTSRKVLELNAKHPIVRCLLEQGDAVDYNAVEMLYQSSLLASGFALDHPAEFAAHMQELIASHLKLA
jgi:molecular chaperone HtpG